MGSTFHAKRRLFRLIAGPDLGPRRLRDAPCSRLKGWKPQWITDSISSVMAAFAPASKNSGSTMTRPPSKASRDTSTAGPWSSGTGIVTSDPFRRIPPSSTLLTLARRVRLGPARPARKSTCGRVSPRQARSRTGDANHQAHDSDRYERLDRGSSPQRCGDGICRRLHAKSIQSNLRSSSRRRGLLVRG
jgi:hypothetical protein